MKKKADKSEQDDKPKRGRPPGGKGRTPQRTYRLGDSQWRIIERAAELLGTTTADFQRDTLLRRAREVLRRFGEMK